MFHTVRAHFLIFFPVLILNLIQTTYRVVINITDINSKTTLFKLQPGGQQQLITSAKMSYGTTNYKRTERTK